jgi:hypothetical protein
VVTGHESSAIRFAQGSHLGRLQRRRGSVDRLSLLILLSPAAAFSKAFSPPLSRKITRTLREGKKEKAKKKDSGFPYRPEGTVGPKNHGFLELLCYTPDRTVLSFPLDGSSSLRLGGGPRKRTWAEHFFLPATSRFYSDTIVCHLQRIRLS